jgi:predicted AAA+ superfamily ATPase
MIPRILEKTLAGVLLPNAPRKVVCIFGARQTGKTTLMRKLFDKQDGRKEFYNGDFDNDRVLFAPTREALQQIAAHLDYLFIDEAQNIPDIERVLKLLHDCFPRLRIVASGSASFDLRRRTGEPPTGRQLVLEMFPLSLAELVPTPLTLQAHIEHGLIYGSYPEVAQTADPAQKQNLLRQLAADYLLKDIFAHVDASPDRLRDLLRLLAFQIGSEVSLNELAAAARMDFKTVDRYIGLLEGAHVIFRLGAFSRNLRKEISKSRKIFFTDLGIRNALLNAFAPLRLRDDTGHLWENYLVTERRKFLVNSGRNFAAWFWRTYDRQEIDYIEEREGALSAFEFKWGAKARDKLPLVFAEAYPGVKFTVVNRENCAKFLL